MGSFVRHCCHKYDIHTCTCDNEYLSICYRNCGDDLLNRDTVSNRASRTAVLEIVIIDIMDLSRSGMFLSHFIKNDHVTVGCIHGLG